MSLLANSQVFAAIVGSEHIHEDAGPITIAPATTGEVAAVLKLCAEQGLTASPAGSGSKRGWGDPTATAVTLDTRRLSGVRDHSWGDLTATVGAGTSWRSLQQTLAQHGQRVALDPLFDECATVGGILATNDSGLLRVKYGSLRDLLIGITVVLADGTIARSGGKVVKNVAGYDLPKLLTGSFGTLGIITEATFRLHPVPRHTVSFTVRSQEVAPLADLMSTLLKTSMSLEAMQLRTETLTYALDLQLGSLPQVLAEHELHLRALAPALAVDASTADIWQHRDRLFTDPAATVIKVTTLPNKLAAIVAGMAHLAQMPDHTASCVADPVGIVTAALTAAPAALAVIIEDLRARLAPIGGAVIILRRGSLPAHVDNWGMQTAPLGIMRAIKQEFDPQRLLNPGKFVGGI